MEESDSVYIVLRLESRKDIDAIAELLDDLAWHGRDICFEAWSVCLGKLAIALTDQHGRTLARVEGHRVIIDFSPYRLYIYDANTEKLEVKWK